jgi:basic amino acid/polyamine antiporter, APA family
MDVARLRLKPIGPDEDPALRRTLGRWDLMFLGIGAIIGAGVFVLTGEAAATRSGPALVLSFVVAGFACAFSAFAYAELAASVGGCGSAYGYAYAALGEAFAWFIGWALMLEYGMAISAVAVGWSGYFNNALAAAGVTLPEFLLRGPSSGGIINLPAVAVIALLGVILAHGARTSSSANGIIVVVKLVAITVFILVGVGDVDPANWRPFMPYGWDGVFQGAAYIFFAYIGFDAVSTAADEAREPSRDLPFGIIGSLAVCTVIYILVAGVLTGMAPYTTLNVPSPVAQVLLDHGHRFAAALVAAGAIAGLTSVMLVMYFGQARILMAMSRDRLLPDAMGAVDAGSGTPRRAIILTGVITAAIAGFVPIGTIAELVNIGTLAAYAVVCLGVITLRRLRPDLPRPFRTPYSPLIPILGLLSCLFLIANLAPATWLRFAVWTGLGIVVYVAYGYRRSRLAS